MQIFRGRFSAKTIMKLVSTRSSVKCYFSTPRGGFLRRPFSSISSLQGGPEFDLFEPTPVHTHLRETVKSFAENEVEPQANDFNREERYAVGWLCVWAECIDDHLLNLLSHFPHSLVMFIIYHLSPSLIHVSARFNQALFRKLGDMGLLGITVPEEYGGAGADVTAACIVHEELVRAVRLLVTAARDVNRHHLPAALLHCD